MQMNFDLTDTEIVNLKRKIDELDPVAQAEKVVDYLGKNYTQKQLGEKLGKTRDWVAKRVQFIRVLEKLKKAEQEEIKNLVRCHTISMEVVILVAGLPKEQREEILSKCPTVSEARRLISEQSPACDALHDAFHQKSDSELTHDELAKLVYELDKNLSTVYRQLEYVTQAMIGLAWEGGEFYAPSEMDPQRILDFNKKYWDENYHFGRMSQIDLELSFYRKRRREHLLARLAFLKASDGERLKQLHEAYFQAYHLTHKLLVTWSKDSPARKWVEDILYGKEGELDLFSRIPHDKRKKVYHALCKAFHPDKAHGISEDEKAEQTELLKIITGWWREYQEKG